VTRKVILNLIIINMNTVCFRYVQNILDGEAPARSALQVRRDSTTHLAPLIAMLLASHVGHGLGFVHRFVGPSTLMDPKFSSVGRRAVVIRTW
jgi:hypothetical protein